MASIPCSRNASANPSRRRWKSAFLGFKRTPSRPAAFTAKQMHMWMWGRMRIGIGLEGVQPHRVLMRIGLPPSRHSAFRSPRLCAQDYLPVLIVEVEWPITARPSAQRDRPRPRARLRCCSRSAICARTCGSSRRRASSAACTAADCRLN